ncbi:MAG: hypothetical protein DCC43_12210 [Candidatus Brocadia sp.]|nr:MAG: hypothetical protein DCC43_12210 [Candidatus Brocadia sp.]
MFQSLVCLYYLLHATCQADPPQESVLKLYKNISKNSPLKIRGTSATFHEGAVSWTIFGALQEKGKLHVPSSNWSVGQANYEVLVVNEPISDTLILPYADPVSNTAKNDHLKIRATQGEYEPASFVIRSGNEPLQNVHVAISQLKRDNSSDEITANNIDIRVVKCWYQSSDSIHRGVGKGKCLTPELLLHDANIIRVDFDHQVNLVRSLDKLRDADQLKPFTVSERMNQQIWLTVHIPENAIPGNYQGEIIIGFSIKGEYKQTKLKLFVEVLPFKLVDSPIEYVLFYMGWLKPPDYIGLDARGKTSNQMLNDFKDMKAHGLTNIAIDHQYKTKKSGQPDLDNLIPVMLLMREAGFNTSRYLYVDWKVSQYDNPIAYRNKIQGLHDIALANGFTELFVYHLDERNLDTILGAKQSLEITHSLGVKNFVATKPEFSNSLKGLLDIAILDRAKKGAAYKASSQGIIPWAYGTPQAGEEKPCAYRDVYGIKLWLDGFEGVCNYAYQTGVLGWDDWSDQKWRPHNMVYPTLDSPITTLQWEGFREGIDDMKYAATLLSLKHDSVNMMTAQDRKIFFTKILENDLPRNPTELRELIIKKLLSNYSR